MQRHAAEKVIDETAVHDAGPGGIIAQPLEQAGLSPSPNPVSPLGYASLAALVGLAAGMVMAPWLEKLYRRATTRPHRGEDE